MISKIIKKLLLILGVLPNLGFYNVLYAVWYKLSLKYGWRKRLFPIGESVNGPFYKEVQKHTVGFLEEWRVPLIIQAEQILKGEFSYFSYHKKKVGEVPNWFHNPFENKNHSQSKKHWTEISDFSEGDIKVIWELSRFDWLTVLARAYKVTTEKIYLERINELLNNWSQENPLNQGPNWKCGQETSIRLMKLMTSAVILDQFSEPMKSLQDLIYQHLQRIQPNLTYAIIQDNNHGTSESAGMYIGAAWLLKTGYESSDLERIKNKGRKVFEERILKLIQPQGTFSQRSMTYHRVMVDTATFVLHMMNELDESEFSAAIKNRLTSLGEWQYKMTIGKEGDAPNFGSNDGAMLENLHSCDYRDFRVSTQTLFGLLSGEKVYNTSSLDEALYWRVGSDSSIFPLRTINLPKHEIFDNQILLLRNNKSTVFVKIPDDTYRPGNDAFHIDLWVKGEEVICDSGTYSYNDTSSDYYKSVAAHNTIQFGDHEQMPKIGRFLYGNWLKPDYISQVRESEIDLSWTGRYTDYIGNQHSRTITLSETSLRVEDRVNTEEKAVARYRFAKDNYLSDFTESKDQKTTSNISKYYYQKQESKALEIQATVDGKIDFTYVFDKN